MPANVTHPPDARARFGRFGGRFVPETVMTARDELEVAVNEALGDPEVAEQRDGLARDYVGRPTLIYLAGWLMAHVGGARIYLKREDLAPTAAHKINKAPGQALIAGHLGKRRIVAETGAGRHGVATATVCARFGRECIVYLGEEDLRRQRSNVVRMGLRGSRSYVPCDEHGQVLESHSISAGLDYLGVGPEHALLAESGRAEYVPVSDDRALESFHRLGRREGIIPALESSHAPAAQAEDVARELGPDGSVLVRLSGRGDKDVDTVVGAQA